MDAALEKSMAYVNLIYKKLTAGPIDEAVQTKTGKSNLKMQKKKLKRC